MSKAYLTPEREAKFTEFMRKWQSRLGLMGWRLEYRSTTKSTALADVKIDHGARQASYRTGPWKPPANEPTDRALEATAVHELLHVLLADFAHLIETGAEAVAIETAEHAIINTLEPLLMSAQGKT